MRRKRKTIHSPGNTTSVTGSDLEMPSSFFAFRPLSWPLSREVIVNHSSKRYLRLQITSCSTCYRHSLFSLANQPCRPFAISIPSALLLKQHYPSRTHNRSRKDEMEDLKRPSSPIERTSSPYSNPRVAGPRSQQLKQGQSNFHSTSLRTMVSNTVNKTSLHPGGVL